MDDFSIGDESLTRSLDQLRVVNRWLGGYASLFSVLKPYLLRRAGPTRLLDIGCGVGDFAELLATWAVRQNPAIDLQIVAVDANPATVAHANASLQSRLSPEAAALVRVELADALQLPYGDGAFDVATASMFLHHFADDMAVPILASMARVAKDGVIVNDLHRHPVAYHGFRAAATILGATPMVRHDGAVSVLRGFTRKDLTRLAHRAGLVTTGPRWRWAFRWVLSTLPS
jgi:ubiquinone/menaquinone biosynthesis C-methylase UbiE